MPAHCPLNLDNNMIDYLEALVHDSDRTMEFLRGLFDKRRKQGFQSEVDILGPIWDLEEMGDVFRAFWQIASKRTGVVNTILKSTKNFGKFKNIILVGRLTRPFFLIL